MSSGQKVIKYCALAFAIFLIVSIFKGIFSLGYSIINGFDFDIKREARNYDNASTYLDIDLKYTDLKIVSGDAFKYETDNENIEVEQNENKMTIKEKKVSVFKKKKDSSITVYIPSSIVLDNTYIGAGAGKIEVENLYTKELRMDLGAGKSVLSNLTVLDSTKIDTGAGDINIDNSNLNNLDIDLGVGYTRIYASLHGLTKIDCGIGNLELSLFDDIDLYTIEIDKGLGKVKLDDKEVTTNPIGNGENKIKIDGGVGNINIKTYGA